MDKLDPEELDAFNRIASSGKHMANLIDDILELSRITRRTIKKERIDLSAIARNVMLKLSVIEPNRKIHWKLQDNMEATGDRHLVEVLLQNLMDNARKFTRDEAKPIIEVGEQQVDGETTYFVKDNGVGFDVAYVDNIFVPFHRLHRQSFEGAGVGLATVRRVVERHGGKVWADSEEGRGAVFYFTLGE